MDNLSPKYDKFVLIGDFNAEDSEFVLQDFLQKHDASNIVKDATCFKSLKNPSCIDLLLTNKPRSFQNTKVLSTGLSDFHKLVVSVLKKCYKKAPPQELHYRDYKKFKIDKFKKELKDKLKGTKIGYNNFENTFLNVLDKHAPFKKKLIRANHAPYMTKALRKAIMRRSELRNKYLKKKTPESLRSYKKQKNFCSKFYKKERKRFYNNINLTDIDDNKQFWKTVKPFLSDKGAHTSKISLNFDEKIISDDSKVSEIFSDFFEGTIKELGIKGIPYFIESASDDKDHPSIVKIREFCEF